MHEDYTKLSLTELRQIWSKLWGIEPHAKIGRTMLEKSLHYKLLQNDICELPKDTNERLNQLVKSYKRNSKYFDEYKPILKPGTRLIRNWNGNRHSVLVLKNGEYEYQGKTYSSLSQIAFHITGTRWNGWVFFGLKKKEDKS